MFLQILRDNPLLLLFLVAAIGYPLGRLKVGGASLGVAAVLFVGLAFGALDPDLKLPEVVYNLGLVLFVYTIGLSSGSIFFGSLRRQGMKTNLLVAGMLALAGGLVAAAKVIFQIKTPLAAGMFAGSLTNTPALAGVLEHVRATAPAALVDQMTAEPVIAYSLTYPMGVLGMILVIYLLQRLWRIDYHAEMERAHEFGVDLEPLDSCTVRVQADQQASIAELVSGNDWDVIFGRLKHAGQVHLVNGQDHLAVGDLISMVGRRDELERVAAVLGQPAAERLEFDMRVFDRRRVFVSDPEVAGRKLRDLHLGERFGAIVSRVRHGDLEILPHGDTLLALGDQVRILAPHNQLTPVANFFGDSYRAVSEIDVLAFGLGVALGLLVGMIPIPLPGGVTLRLGLAGGTLVVGLALGALGRTGPIMWEIPYSANLTLRQVGLVLFLAGVGTRAGYAFFSTLRQGDGWLVLGAGAAITCITGLATLWMGHKVLRIPMSLMVGVLAGLQTQPAVLGFGLEQSGNELPNIGYATVYPVAMIVKILLAQVLLILFL
ncbi:predicted permease [Longilinea arvoryzae]|uniref:Predicted permease n=1 Tax=Longilinea arvoryzae TaxID=360412 RepID=A0A0S7BM14_9CHLR|nr:aspartate:alanine exchanger family transporter [Longilinea arvoryzae]GAP15558.1 predicted permease [Longilinea arvoryzae]